MAEFSVNNRGLGRDIDHGDYRSFVDTQECSLADVAIGVPLLMGCFAANWVSDNRNLVVGAIGVIGGAAVAIKGGRVGKALALTGVVGTACIVAERDMRPSWFI